MRVALRPVEHDGETRSPIYARGELHELDVAERSAVQAPEPVVSLTSTRTSCFDWRSIWTGRSGQEPLP